MAGPFDFLNSINDTKVNLLEEDPAKIKDYNPFIVNRSLSMFMDTVLLANEMNVHSKLDKDMQYTYFLGSINKRKRFSKWHKPETSDNLELIKTVYSVNNSRATEILKLLTEDQINLLKRQQEKGGIGK